MHHEQSFQSMFLEQDMEANASHHVRLHRCTAGATVCTFDPKETTDWDCCPWLRLMTHCNNTVMHHHCSTHPGRKLLLFRTVETQSPVVVASIFTSVLQSRWHMEAGNNKVSLV